MNGASGASAPWLAPALLALLAALAALLAAWAWSRRGAGGERWLPPALRGAVLVHSEALFESARHGLVARLDRAYRGRGGLHLVELKTRPYVAALASDVIELSVQRLVLQEATGEPVSMQAWVAVQRGGRGRPQPVAVTLLPEAEVMRLRRRLLEVRRGRGRAPVPAAHPGVCAACAHADVCTRTYGDRPARERG